MERNTVGAIAWAMVVALFAGIALLGAGATVVGAAILGTAALGLGLLLLAAPRRGGQPRSAQLLHRLARNELDVAAIEIGIARDDLRRAVDDGRTISAVAADAGVPARKVIDAVVRDASAEVDRAVEAGNVAPNRARVVHTRIPYWAENFVLSTPAMLAAAPLGP